MGTSLLSPQGELPVVGAPSLAMWLRYGKEHHLDFRNKYSVFVTCKNVSFVKPTFFISKKERGLLLPSSMFTFR